MDWPTALDDFEASLASVEACLISGAWETASWDWDPPADDLGPVTEAEAARLRELLARRTRCRLAVEDAQDALQAELDLGPDRRAGIASYVSSEGLLVAH